MANGRSEKILASRWAFISVSSVCFPHCTTFRAICFEVEWNLESNRLAIREDVLYFFSSDRRHKTLIEWSGRDLKTALQPTFSPPVFFHGGTSKIVQRKCPQSNIRWRAKIQARLIRLNGGKRAKRNSRNLVCWG